MNVIEALKALRKAHKPPPTLWKQLGRDKALRVAHRMILVQGAGIEEVANQLGITRTHLRNCLAEKYGKGAVGRRPLSDAEKAEILRSDDTLDAISVKFNRSKRLILLVKQGAIHAIPGVAPVRVHKRAKRKYGSRRPRRVFIRDEIFDIRCRKGKIQDIADAEGCDYRTIWQIKHFKTYRDMPQPIDRPAVIPKRGNNRS